jgi:hypothetical protein
MQNLALSDPPDMLWPGLFELGAPGVTNYLDEQNAGLAVGLGVKKPLGQIVPRKRAFVRQCYIELSAKVAAAYDVKESVTVALTGTPGIGKSIFSLLFLVDLIRHLHDASPDNLVPDKFGIGLNGHIVYEHVIYDSPSYYLIDVATKSIIQSLVRPLDWLNDKHSFLIKDGPCQAYDVECSVLWASSPRAGGFQKAHELDGKQFILPPWTADELIACWRAGCAPETLFHFSEDSGDQTVRDVVEDVKAAGHELEGNLLEEAILRRLTADLGPVARRVFNPTKGYNFLQAAVDDLGNEELNDLVSYANTEATNSNKFKYSHRLLLMSPSDDFKTFVFVPSSVKIGHRVLAKGFKRNIEEARKLMGKMNGAHLGLVFEPYAHFMLCEGGNFSMYELLDNERGSVKQLVLAKQNEVIVSNSVVDADGFNVTADTYYIPTDPRFPVVDSWTSSEMFQMTVNMKHPIKSGNKLFKKVMKVMTCITADERSIIFVVPKQNVERFVFQPFVTEKGDTISNPPPLKQYVLGLIVTQSP